MDERDDATDDALSEEYRQWCADWRTRDGYVQNKFFSAAVVIFTVGQVIVRMPSLLTDRKPGELVPVGFLFALVGFYMFAAAVSTVKDMYYREGTERAVKIAGSLLDFRKRVCGVVDQAVDEKVVVRPENPRKIKATHQALEKAEQFLPPTRLVTRFLSAVHTYELIVLFYLAVALLSVSYAAYVFCYLARPNC